MVPVGLVEARGPTKTINFIFKAKTKYLRADFVQIN